MSLTPCPHAGESDTQNCRSCHGTGQRMVLIDEKLNLNLLHVIEEPKNMAKHPINLNIAAGINLSPEVVTQTFAILAKRRTGKTYTASVLAEEMVKAKLPFVVLDPTGAWWGLRASADGKKEGYPVVIIGGAHGDIPLDAGAGKIIADLVVDHPGWYVIDLSQTNSNAEQDRIAGDFAEQLYRRKAKNTFPLHLFVDEADSFAPQQAFPNQKKMLGAFEAIVRRGGIRGIGTTLITQRPAVLNKNVLTQADNLIVLCITSPQDRAAIDDWVKGNGTKEERDIMMNSLASLGQGDAWIWSPSALGIFQRVKIRQRETFNSSATPKAGEYKHEPKKLAKVDLENLRDKIATTIEKAKAEDPELLRKEIANLKHQLSHSKPSTNEIEDAVNNATKPLLGLSSKCEQLRSVIIEHLKNLDQLRSGLNDALFKVANTHVGEADYSKIKPSHAKNKQIVTPEKIDDHSIVLPKGELAILSVIAQYPQGATKDQITVITGYKRSSRDAYLQRLTSKNLIDQNGSFVITTKQGIVALGSSFEPLPTGRKLQEHWLNKLPQGEASILKILLETYPDSIDRQSLTDATDYKRSSRDAYLQRLNSRKLIEIGANGEIYASKNFFN